MYTIEQLNDKLLSELKKIAEELKINGIAKFSKQDLIYKIIDEQAVSKPSTDNKLQDKKRKISKKTRDLDPKSD